jgi:hypothetical protein
MLWQFKSIPRNPKLATWSIIVIACILLTWLVFHKQYPPEAPAPIQSAGIQSSENSSHIGETNLPQTEQEVLPKSLAAPVKQTLDFDPLDGYASPDSNFESDNRIIESVLSTAFLLIKGDSPPAGSNAMMVTYLQGENSAGIQILPDTHPSINPSGEIVDRLDTPLFFHGVSAQQIGVRSAGMDRLMWTSDDVYLGLAAEPLPPPNNHTEIRE